VVQLTTKGFLLSLTGSSALSLALPPPNVFPIRLSGHCPRNVRLAWLSNELGHIALSHEIIIGFCPRPNFNGRVINFRPESALPSDWLPLSFRWHSTSLLSLDMIIIFLLCTFPLGSRVTWPFFGVFPTRLLLPQRGNKVYLSSGENVPQRQWLRPLLSLPQETRSSVIFCEINNPLHELSSINNNWQIFLECTSK